MEQINICPICKRKFLPGKYRRTQRVCSRPECQHQRQLNNLTAWREKNPGYFKVSRHNSSWARLYCRHAQRWRKKNKGRVKKYKKAHREEYREYMREYMRRLRQVKGWAESSKKETENE